MPLKEILNTYGSKSRFSLRPGSQDSKSSLIELQKKIMSPQIHELCWYLPYGARHYTKNSI
jgi:hypothetical protein